MVSEPVRENLQERRDGVPDRDLVGAHEFEPVGGVQAAPLIGQHNGPAGREHPEDVPDREVKGEAGNRQHPVSRGQIKHAVDGKNGVHGPFMAYHDAFGFTGGSGRVDHVSQAIRAGRGSLYIEIEIQFQ